MLGEAASATTGTLIKDALDAYQVRAAVRYDCQIYLQPKLQVADLVPGS